MRIKTNYEVQIDNCTDTELEELFSRLDSENRQALLNSLEKNIKRRKDKLEDVITKNCSQKKVCKLLLEELWDCLSDIEKEKAADFFKSLYEKLQRM